MCLNYCKTEVLLGVNMNKKDLCSTKQTTKKIALTLDLHKLMLKILELNKIISPLTDNVKLTIEDEILLFRKLMQYGNFLFFVCLFVCLFAFSLGSIIKGSHHLCKHSNREFIINMFYKIPYLWAFPVFWKKKLGEAV